jgi:hypothetical protein
MTIQDPNYQFVKVTCGVIATVGLYSVLYRETKIYRFFEHMFLGLAAGYSLTALWTVTLKNQWYDKLVGKIGEDGKPGQFGAWPWILILPLAFMAYLIFHRKHNWMSRIPLGIIMGFAAGQTFLNWFNTYGPQIGNSIKPVIPTAWSLAPKMDALTGKALEDASRNVYVSQAVNNVIFLVTLVCVMSYFIFCTEFKSKFLMGMSTAGRLLLMVGFGAIFGATIMTRFALLIDRMYFVWVEWFLQGILHKA